MKKKTVEINPKSWKQLAVAILLVLPMVFSGITQMKNWVQYDLLGNPRNNEERLVSHMTTHHLFTNDTPLLEQPIDVGDGEKVMIRAYADKCVVTSKTDKYGKVLGFKILADPELIDRLTSHPIKIMTEAHAGYAQRFEFGFHRNDNRFIDNRGRHRGEVIRTYLDKYKCRLSYMVDKYGNTHSWRWLEYNHRVPNG